MHLVTAYKSRALTALPSVLPPGLYDAAARRGAPPPPGSRNPSGPPTGIPRQFTGSQRAQSPLTRPSYATPPLPLSAQTTGGPGGWLITPQEKAKYDQFFNGIDTAGEGHLNGEQAVRFFSDSGLPEDTLAQIWDLADINSEGRLSRDEFAVAMYLIRQERSKPAGAASLPAFLPQALIPPSLRNQPRPAPQTTAPAFDNAANTSQLPKSAAEDLFGLDASPPKPTPPAPIQTAQMTGPPPAFGASASRDPFAVNKPSSPPPTSPQATQRSFSPQPSMFKPFMPSSAFGASLAAQHTGSSNTSSQPQYRPAPPPSAMDDLLGEAPESETRNITNDTTELANMSNQIGNLRNQMQDVQTKKDTHQRDLTATNNQKRDLEQRLQQFRAQYEQEVRTVKTLEEQLTASRSETQRLQQDVAMIEGTYQDLATQHQTVSQQLATDQQENINLKQRISQLNAEVAQLKPQVEKMRSDARQQKGMVAINKKQLSTNEGERDGLHGEMASLKTEAEERALFQQQHQERESQLQEREGHHQARESHLQELERHFQERERQLQERENQQAQHHQHAQQQEESQQAAIATQLPEEHDREIISPQPKSAVVSPALSASTNPFFRSAGAPRDAGTLSPAAFAPSPPSTSAFDALFGPSFSSSQQPDVNGPPATSFKAGDEAPSGQSVSSEGRPTPSATPPLSRDDHEPPPPPESRQFTPGILPMRSLQHEASFDSSVRAAAPGSIDTRSVTSPFDGQNAFEHSPFGHEGVATPPAQISGPSFQELHANQPREPVRPHESEESMPGAFPEDGVTPMTAQTTGQSQATHPNTAKDDFESAFAGFGEPAQSKGKEPATDVFQPVAPGMNEASRGFGDEFPAIRELQHDDDSDSESERGFDDDFSAGPSAGNGAPLEKIETEHIEHAAPPSFAEAVPESSSSAVVDEPLRPGLTEDSRANTDLPAITAQMSPPSYESSLPPHRSGSNGNVPPEFENLLPSREDPTTATYSVPQQVPQTPTTAGSDVFHDAGSRPVSSFTDLGTANAASTATTALPGSTEKAKSNAFDDDFAEFDDLDEAKEATGDESGFGNDSESRGGDEFNPNFDSPSQSVSTWHHGGTASQEHTPVVQSRQFSSGANGFGDFESNASHNQPAIASPFGNTQAPQAQGSHDWDAIFSGLDASPAVDTDPTASAFGGSHGTPFVTTASGPVFPDDNATAEKGSSGSPFPVTDNSGFGSSVGSGSGVPTSSKNETLGPPPVQKPQLGRAITNTGEHDDPTVKRLTGMGFARDKAVKALEDYDYNIDQVRDVLIL